jgi:DNA-binding CsgD family transcriptional regulator
MKATPLTNCNLEELLATLPALPKPCYLCSPLDDPDPAVIREPGTGWYLCARCAMEHVAGWADDRASLEQVAYLTALASTLSRRETEALRLLALGHSDMEIAHAMSIQRTSVHWHICNVKDKLGLRERTQLVLCALKIGLVELSDIELSIKKEEGLANGS